MKATIFRIGNLVSYNRKKYEVTLQSLYEGANLDWKPILITKKLLLNFGFKECELGGLSIKTDEYEMIEFNSALFCWVNGTKKPIKYVHQLQNLYYALTQKELKFKKNIKKQKVLIEDSDMSVRLINRLNNKVSFSCNKQVPVITYLDEISNYTKKEVYEIYDLRAKEMKELQEVMLRFDIEFKEE